MDLIITILLVVTKDLPISPRFTPYNFLIQPEYGEMSRLTRDGTAEPVSRDQILRHARGQGNIIFPCSADHEQDWQPYPVDPYSAICDDHTHTSRCKFSTLTTRQPMVEFYFLTFPRFPLRKKEHKSYFGKNRTPDFRTSRCAGYLLDHSGDEACRPQYCFSFWLILIEFSHA